MKRVVAAACLMASGLVFAVTFLEGHRASFYPGSEFPGATGSLQVAEGELRLSFDFSKGGHYVAANFPLPERPTVRGVSFEADCPDGAFVTLRFTDATGQVFQQYLGGDTDGWEPFATRADAPGGRWGGANDGVFHQPVRHFSIIADNLTPDAVGGACGTLRVRNVRFSEQAPASAHDTVRPARTIEQLLEEAHSLRDELARELPAMERRGLGAKTRATVAVMDNFFPWLREDVARGFTNRAHRALWEMVDIGRAGLARLARIRVGAEVDALVPHYVTSPVETSHAQLVAMREWPDGRRERGNVILTGFGHFGTVQREMAKLPPLGNHIIQMEIGPRSFLPTETTVNTNAIRPFLVAAERGARENVQICLLLSPHYFPEWALRKWPELRECEGGFFRYCVHDPRARSVLEKSLRTVIPLIRGNPALHSVCLSNEPECGFHGAHCALRGEWPKWLERAYGTPVAMNAAWRTSYATFADVPVPKSYKDGRSTPETLAFIRFNREAFAEFHRWMADVIHSMAPELPVHSKIMVHALFGRNATYWSVDPEAFSRLSQYNGNDAVDSPIHNASSGWAHGWWSMEAGYDYQRSCLDAPVFNTENHIIPDREKRSIRGEHVYTALWQNTVHGQGANTLWVWERAYDNGRSDFNGLILERPACLEAWAHCALDLSRLVDRLAPIQNLPPSVLIHWSLASQVRDPLCRRAGHFLSCYRAANVLGQPLGVVTERMLAAYGRGGARERPLDNARVVLLPDASHIPPEVRAGLDRLAADGVAVVELPERSERQMARRILELSRGWKLPDYPRVTAPEGNDAPRGVESRGYRADGKSYVTFVNHMARPRRVRLEAPGRDLIRERPCRRFLSLHRSVRCL